LPLSLPEGILDPRLRVVEDYWNAPPYNDEPKFFHITAKLRLSPRLKRFLDQSEEDSLASVGGCSLSEERALWKAAGESLERKALFPSRSLARLFRSFDEFGDGEALNPNHIAAGIGESPSERRRFDLEWILGFQVASGEPLWIPCQLVQVPHIFRRGETIIRTPITTGAAFSSSLHGAILTGLCEVVERDAFMVAWLRQLQLTRIDLGSYGFSGQTGLLLESTLKACARYRLGVQFFLLPNDTSLRCVLAIVQDQSGVGPPLTLGARAHWDFSSALLGALEEANQLRPWLRKLWVTSKDASIGGDILLPRSLEQRAILSMSPESTRRVLAWLGESVKVILPVDDAVPPSLPSLIKEVESHGYQVLAVNLSSLLPKVLRRSGFAVAKVIIPQYQPLYLTEALKDYSWERLASAERRLSSSAQRRLSEIYHFPHPFL
jgi:ribosomal protein S12 methylthiotransferase accessory factor